MRQVLLPDTRLTGRAMRERFGVSDMTIWRWLHDATLAFPKPMVINRRKYWRLADVEAWERAQMSVQVAA